MFFFVNQKLSDIVLTDIQIHIYIVDKLRLI